MFIRAQNYRFKLLLWSNQQSKDSSFTTINDNEKQQICTFKKLEPRNVLYFCLKNNCSIKMFIATHFSVKYQNIVRKAREHYLVAHFVVKPNIFRFQSEKIYIKISIFLQLERENVCHFSQKIVTTGVSKELNKLDLPNQLVNLLFFTLMFT